MNKNQILDTIDSIANQLSRSIHNNFDIYFEPSYGISSLDKLVIMINILAEEIQDNSRVQQEQYEELQNGVESALQTITNIAKRNFTIKASQRENNPFLIKLANGVNQLSKTIQDTTISSEYFSQIFGSLPSPLIVCDKNLRIKHANQAAYSFTGLENCQLINTELMDHISLINHEHNILDIKQSKNKTFDVQIKHISGSYCDAHMLMTELDNSFEILIVLQDLTQIIKAQQDREEALEQLHHSQKIESIGTLVAGVAHDFNNILNAAMGYLELLDNSVQLNQQQANYFTKINNSLTRAAELVDSLLRFSRKQQDDKKLKKCNINALIIESTELLSRTFAKGVNIKLELCDNDVYVLGQPAQIMQVFINLCINASHAIANVGQILIVTKCITLNDTIKSLKSGRYVKVLVSDNGSGIAPEHVNKIFDPYYTTKPIGKGSGLGLSSSYGILKEYGGKLSLVSSSADGTCFSALLPRVENENENENGNGNGNEE